MTRGNHQVDEATHSPLFAAVGGRAADLIGERLLSCVRSVFDTMAGTVELLLRSKCDISELDENGQGCCHC